MVGPKRAGVYYKAPLGSPTWLAKKRFKVTRRNRTIVRSHETRVAIASLGNRSSTTGRVSSFNLQKSIRIYKKRTWRFLRYLDFQMHGRPLAELLLDLLVTHGPNRPRMVPPAICPGFGIDKFEIFFKAMRHHPNHSKT